MLCAGSAGEVTVTVIGGGIACWCGNVKAYILTVCPPRAVIHLLQQEDEGEQDHQTSRAHVGHGTDGVGAAATRKYTALAYGTRGALEWSPD